MLLVTHKNMLHSISCKNFYSFGDLNTLSFLVNDNAPQNNGYFTTPSGTRLSKVETVIGGNASGKTNLLKTLPFLKWFIIDSFNLDPQSLINFRPFMFGEYKNKPAELSVIFEVETGVYTYSFILDQTKIISEELKLVSMAKEKKSSKKIFLRTWNSITKSYDFEGDNFNLPKGFENLIRPNASIIGVAMRLNHKESQEIVNFWRSVETNVSEAGWIGDNMFINRGQQLAEVLDFFSEKESLKKDAEKLLARFDLGLNSFEIKKEKQDGGISMMVNVSHSFGNQKEVLPIQYESSGTKQLFILLKHILQAISNGGVVVLDEFDVNLHPEMMIALFDLFIDPNINEKNAQLLFSTHNHYILSKLDKYQITLIEKNEKGMSESWRLDEMAGVRADDNYYTKYIAGAYGAFPKM